MFKPAGSTMDVNRYRKCLLTLMLMAACQSGNTAAEKYPVTQVENLVTLVETDDSLCLAHGGQLISVRLTEAALTSAQGPGDVAQVEVWVDRWFMQVQTADHTRHVLSAETPEQELGCSQSLAGPQHWTLGASKRLPAAGAIIKPASGISIQPKETL
jgi:putative hemolysin